MELRKLLLGPLDDLLVVTGEFDRPEVSSGLEDLTQHEAFPRAPIKRFKDYVPSFTHVNMKYLLQIPGGHARHYLFTTIDDRASRWVYVEILSDKTDASGFLERLIQAIPFRLIKALADNGKESAYRFCATGEREPTETHVFDQVYATHAIEHRLIKLQYLQTNSMVSAFQRSHYRDACHYPFSQRRAPVRNARPLRAGLQPAHSAAHAGTWFARRCAQWLVSEALIIASSAVARSGRICHSNPEELL